MGSSVPRPPRVLPRTDRRGDARLEGRRPQARFRRFLEPGLRSVHAARRFAGFGRTRHPRPDAGGGEDDDRGKGDRLGVPPRRGHRVPPVLHRPADAQVLHAGARAGLSRFARRDAHRHCQSAPHLRAERRPLRPDPVGARRDRGAGGRVRARLDLRHRSVFGPSDQGSAGASPGPEALGGLHPRAFRRALPRRFPRAGAFLRCAGACRRDGGGAGRRRVQAGVRGGLRRA